MMIIAQQLSEAISKVLTMSIETGSQKQAAIEARRQYLLKCKATGDQFIVIKDLFAEACVDDPVELEWGTFSSYTQFIKQASSLNCGFPARSTIEKYVGLAKNWYVVEKLDMLHDDHCYRLDCTIRIIEWYLGHEVSEREHLTVSNYWSEFYDNKPGIVTKKELQAEVSLLRDEVGKLRDESVPKETYDYIYANYQQKVSEVELLRRELEEARLTIQQLEAKQLSPEPTYKFTPPTMPKQLSFN